VSSLHKRLKSQFWWGKFRDETGAVRYRSTKKTKRGDALEVLLAWQHGSDAAKRGELTKAVVLKTLNEILERTTGERLEVFTVQTFLRGWLNAKTTTGKSEGTTSRYKSIVDGFLTFLGEKRASVSVAGITATDVQGYRDSEIRMGKSPSSADLAVKVIRAVLNDAKRKGLILANPADAVELFDMPSHERQPFTDEQIAKLLKVADGEWKGMILLGAHAGWRIGDAATLLWHSVDIAAATLTFTAQKTARRNHGKPQTIAMHPELLRYFEELSASDDPNAPVFPSLASRSAGGNQGLSNRFTALMEKAKIHTLSTQKGAGKGRSFSSLSFHSLRHTFISRLANADVNADVRKEIAGHSSDDVHRRYTHLNLNSQRRALKRIKGFLEQRGVD
jgi:integrase